MRESGNTDVQQVRNALRQQSLNAPEGIIAVDVDCNDTLWRIEALLTEGIADLLDVGIATLPHSICPEIDTVVRGGYDVTRDSICSIACFECRDEPPIFFSVN